MKAEPDLQDLKPNPIQNQISRSIEWKFSKYFPGGYKPTRQLPLKGHSLTWAVNIVAGIAIM